MDHGAGEGMAPSVSPTELELLLEEAYRAREEAGPELEAGTPFELHRPAELVRRLREASDEMPDSVGEPGRYRLLGELARGGIGAVLVAEDRTMGRLVAIKVPLRRRAKDRLAIRRFLDEARVSSQLQHPGVIPVHDMGRASDGRPFFAMKLVEGHSLRELLEDPGWRRERSIDVLRRVCEAVQHAHSRGVVHRDLKPDNVLCGPHGEVLVTDWGLAAVRGAARREGGASEEPSAPESTREGDRMGTPAYMSPEQAAGRVAQIGPASDVYALGAILYHVLSGRPPYAELGHGASSEAVCEAVALGPPEALERRAADVPVELVAICRRAMARDPEERYPSAAELARDLEAFQERRVVRAYRTGLLTELRLWSARNRALAASLLVLLLVCVGGSAYVAVRESSAAERERELSGKVRAEADRARAEAVTYEKVASFLVRLFEAADPETDPGRPVLARDVLDEGAEQLRTELRDEPRIRARLLTALGGGYGALSESQRARELYAEAYELLGRELGESSLETLAALKSVADMELECGRMERALELHELCYERLSDTVGPESEPALAAATSIVEDLNLLGRLEEALELGKETVLTCRAELGLDHETTREAIAKLAQAYNLRSMPREALALARALHEHDTSAHGPDDPRTRESRAQLERMQAAVGLDVGEDVLRSDLEEARRVHGVESVNAYRAAYRLGFELAHSHQAEEGLSLLEEAAPGLLERLGPDHPDAIYAAGALGDAALMTGDLERAERIYRDTLERGVRGLGKDHPFLSQVWTALGTALGRAGRFDEAEPAYLEARRIARSAFVEDSLEWLLCEWNLALLYKASGDHERARLRLETLLEQTPDDHPLRGRFEAALAEVEAAADAGR